MKTVLFAGQGSLPVEAAKSLKSKGDDVIVYTFTEQLGQDLSGISDEVKVFSLGQAGKILKSLRESGVKRLVFAGKFNKTILEQNLKLDLKALWILARLKDRQENTMMYAFTHEIEKLGITILSQLDVLSHLILRKGIYSKMKPTRRQMEDVRFAYNKARGIAGLDIGQVVVAKNKTVLAMESLEGTNRTIQRGAEFCQGGFTVIKVAKPEQDYRFDLPVIGMETITAFAAEKGAVFAVEADYTLALDIQECINFANENKFVFMAYTP
ncbi:MAG: UDP-2,3-diacylglucosamine diphosphatase LpxI [Deferribacteraceae bacterium]|jgi:DUF1009 family protein|nr:UDP-2,3-diacylglucosamine diphosphatase LpxI [Deferribacteraceae bacterium]